MRIPFQVSLRENEEDFTVETLWDCDTEIADVGGSEVAGFKTEEEAVDYMKYQVTDYEEYLK